MKKTYLVLALLLLTTFSQANPVPEKIKQSFNQLFSSAQNVRWYTNEEYVEVVFELSEVVCRMKYSVTGRILSTRRDYASKQLHPFLRAKTSERFPKHNIYGVTEIQSEEEFFFLIILEDEKSWLHVRADATGNFTVTDEFKKSKP